MPAARVKPAGRQRAADRKAELFLGEAPEHPGKPPQAPRRPSMVGYRLKQFGPGTAALALGGAIGAYSGMATGWLAGAAGLVTAMPVALLGAALAGSTTDSGGLALIVGGGLLVGGAWMGAAVVNPWLLGIGAATLGLSAGLLGLSIGFDVADDPQYEYESAMARYTDTRQDYDQKLERHQRYQAKLNYMETPGGKVVQEEEAVIVGGIRVAKARRA